MRTKISAEGRWAAGVTALLAAALPAMALVKENPYNSIALRNPFRLQPAAPPPLQRAVEVLTPLPEIVLTGVTDLGGKDQALLEITERGKPIRRPILCEGEVLDAVEVLQIDVAGGLVRLRVMGVETILTLQRKPAASGAIAQSSTVGRPKD